MSQVSVNVTCSLDGFVAGPDQTLENPLGVGAERLHRWMFEDPESNAAELAAITAAGAFVMGRNMFGSGRGAWDESWQGWWGSNPPYHAPVFVLTHHPRPPLTMEGGTTFTFVTEGVVAALEQAKAAAAGQDVAVAGGAATINSCLAHGLIDELRLHVAPVLLGAGERLFTDVGDVQLVQAGARQTELVTHLAYRAAR